MSSLVSHVDAVVETAVLDLISKPANVAKLTAGANGHERRQELSDHLARLDQEEKAFGERLTAGEITAQMLSGAMAALGRRRNEIRTELRSLKGDALLLDAATLGRLEEISPGLDATDRQAAMGVAAAGVEILPAKYRAGCLTLNGSRSPGRVRTQTTTSSTVRRHRSPQTWHWASRRRHEERRGCHGRGRAW